jgi:hypothetical protein
MSQTNSIVLVVHLEEPEMNQFRATDRYCCKPEPGMDLVKSFCHSTGKLRYSEPFVCIAVYRTGEEICSPPATVYGDSTATKKNCYVILKNERVLNDIDTAAQDDFKQLALQMAKRWKNGTPNDSLLRQMKDLRGMTAEQKIIELLWSTQSRGQHGYSEARLSRCLTVDDVVNWFHCP